MEYKALVDSFKNTYCFFRKKYVTMASHYTQTVNHAYGDKVLVSHIEGRYAVAVFAGEKATRFLSVDVDAGGKKAVRQVVDAFIELGIPAEKIYVSMSGQKGYHVDMFFNPWIYNTKAKNLYDLMIWKTGLDPKKVEFRPTHTQAIKLPLGIHAKTGKRCWFLDRETLEPIEDMTVIERIEFIESDEVLALIKAWHKRRWNELYAEMICNDTGRDRSIQHEIIFNGEYFESKRLTKCGTRHDVMIRIAYDMRTYGANRYQIAKALSGFYYRQDPEMIESTEQEVLADIDEIAQWAEESVPVRRYRPSPNEGGGGKPIKFSAEDMNMVLHGQTSASRRIALLIYAYCKLFGAAHLSYDTIAGTVGCSLATVKNSIGDLVKNGIVSKQSGGCHFMGGTMIRKANTYFIPKECVFECPGGSDVLNAEFVYTGHITAETLNDIYYGGLSQVFSRGYLAGFLTKPEMERMSVDSGKSSDHDACGCA